MINHTSGNVQRALINMSLLPGELQEEAVDAFTFRGIADKEISQLTQAEKNFVVEVITKQLRRIN